MQTTEYPMFTPYPRAKLYKRFTSDMELKADGNGVIQIKFNGRIIEVADGGILTVQNNRYVCVGKFRWIENTQKEDTDEQPLNGLIVGNSYITIKTNSLKKFDKGDIVQLPKGTPLAGLWIIDDGKSTDYIFTPKQVQTYQYLPLSSMGLE